MNRYTNSNIFRVFYLFIIALLLFGAFCLTPGRTVQAAKPTEPSDLLQFTAAGHVLGFQAEGVYVAAGRQAHAVIGPVGIPRQAAAPPRAHHADPAEYIGHDLLT